MYLIIGEKAMVTEEFRKDQFIITKKPLNFVPGYLNKSLKLNESILYYNSSSDLSIEEKEDVKIFLFGYVLDIRDSNKDSEEILQNLIQNHHLTLDKFHENLEYLNGRYIIIIDKPEDTLIYTDATSMKPIYYWNSEIFGSHEVIVREAVLKERNIDLKKRWTNGYMDYTGTQSIYKFNCNNYFSFKNNKFIRYFPRENIDVNLSADQVMKETIPYLKEQVNWLSNLNKTLYLSITGGVDSKVSLSILKPLKDRLKLFTYLIDFDKEKNGPKKDIYMRDKVLVDRIVYNLDLNHKYYYFNDFKLPSNFSKSMKYNFSSAHSQQVAYLVRKEMEKNSIHIKSNIYEMAKVPYPHSGYKTTKIEDGYSITKKWLPKSIRLNDSLGKKMYIDSTKRINLTREKLFNANLSMMLYFESKLSNWHSSITQETEAVQDTFILFNNKFLLSKLLCLNYEERHNLTLLKLYIQYFWPFLNYQESNSYHTLDEYRENKVQVTDIINNISILNPMNVSIRSEGDSMFVKPMSNVLLKDNIISFVLVNDDDIDKTINIKSYYSHPEKNIFLHLDNK